MGFYVNNRHYEFCNIPKKYKKILHLTLRTSHPNLNSKYTNKPCVQFHCNNAEYGLTTPAYFMEKFTPFGVTFKNYIFDFLSLLSYCVNLVLMYLYLAISICKLGAKFKIVYGHMTVICTYIYVCIYMYIYTH